MNKILGKEITDVTMVQDFIDCIKLRAIKLIIAFGISCFSMFLFSKAIYSSVFVIFYVVCLVVILWLIGSDKIIYLLKLIPASAKKGWQIGKDFHSIIASCILGYCFFGAVISYIASAYVMMPSVGVAITFIRLVFDFIKAKKYLVEA